MINVNRVTEPVVAQSASKLRQPGSQVYLLNPSAFLPLIMKCYFTRLTFLVPNHNCKVKQIAAL